ncbi:MAG: hypothetical protein Q8K46_02360 [Deltaproteobacteria bacterium]|nr:hypothetical protein [Deltaproteobacteria bacterium]
MENNFVNALIPFSGIIFQHVPQNNLKGKKFHSEADLGSVSDPFLLPFDHCLILTASSGAPFS